MAEHKAIFVSGFDGTDPCAACSLSTKKTPTPGPDEVLVKILCRPINPADILAIQGNYPAWQPKSFPAIPGAEGMGIVHQMGENVTAFKVGQRVYPLNPLNAETGEGSWQEYVLAPSRAIIPIPDSVSDEIASQFLINPWTVYGMFHELNPPEGEYVIQTAASSVLGRMFIQYAHYKGVKTINLVRRNEQKEELKQLGADVVLNYTVEDVEEEVKRLTKGELAFAAIDAIGGEITKLVGSCVRNGATVLNYGVLGAFHVEMDYRDLIFREVHLRGFYVTPWVSRLSHDELAKVAREVMGLLEIKVIQPHLGEKYPLEQFKDAISLTLGAGRGGKVFLVSY